MMNRTMIVISLLFMAIACLISPSLSMGKDVRLTIRVRPEKIGIGEFGLVEISSDMPIKITSTRFGKKDIPFYSNGERRCFSIIGAPLHSKPGREIFTVRWKRNGEQEITSIPVEIVPKTYPEEHLKVARKMVEFPPDILKRVLSDQQAVKTVCSRITMERFWNAPFVWPIQSKIVSPFGLKRFFNGKPRSPHSGIDLRAPLETPVRASNSGRVALVRDCYLSGKTLVIDHGGGLFTLYAHLKAIKVKEGEMVSRGDVVGLSGSSGRATGPHLHWGVSYMANRLDPVSLLRLFDN